MNYARSRKRADNRFSGLVPNPSEDEALISEAMRRLNVLGSEFASQMAAGLMPIDEAIVGKDTATDDAQYTTLHGKRLPVWIVLNGSNLAGEPMFRGSIWDTSFSHPKETQYFSDLESFKTGLKETKYSHFSKAAATDRAVGLTAMGRYVSLSKEIEQDPTYHFTPIPDQYSLSEKGDKA